ncbi:hypothetical protein F5Y18DRAFT_439691 [Xylariaceae sp. FL1019]|nr:hypothetical protein F5Y18DRAFT_439691 [Xylariaceae sp. FL1019]
MPQIGDLLAEISGGQPSAAPSPKPPSSLGVKRKADDDSNGATSTKLTKARQPDGSYSTSKITRDTQGRVVERSYSVSRPVKAALPSRSSTTNLSSLPHRTSAPSTSNGRYEPPAPNTQRFAPTSNGKPSTLPSKAMSSAKPSSDVSSRGRVPPPISSAARASPVKPSPTTPTTSDPSKAPKKGSFKEIMARASKAQETMGKVGTIQHRAIEKPVVKKERGVSKVDPKAGPTPTAKDRMSKPYTGSSRPPMKPGRDSGRPGNDAHRSGSGKDVRPSGKSKPTSNDPPEKKIKKSAVATTGYSGTARARPGATTSKGPSTKSGPRPASGGLLAPPRLGRRSKYDDDEYDEDLDDFVDYDDEEEDDGPRYNYASDVSSDMEAGMSDIDSEERRAEFAAREEDKREQALEEKLKREKEERKRRWAQGGR